MEKLQRRAPLSRLARGEFDRVGLAFWVFIFSLAGVFVGKALNNPIIFWEGLLVITLYALFFLIWLKKN